jgi:hypothetical protein
LSHQRPEQLGRLDQSVELVHEPVDFEQRPVHRHEWPEQLGRVHQPVELDELIV